MRPPMAQLLYDLGVNDKTDVYSALGLVDDAVAESDVRPVGTIEAIIAPKLTYSFEADGVLLAH